MSYKLPDGTEVNCTLIQARRVWELCKDHLDPIIRMSDAGIVIRNPAVPLEPFLVTSDGQVFSANSRFLTPPLPMESEKPPEVSEFHRGVITAIETIWKRKFTTTHWTWEVQDVLARAAADGKINGLATLLETIATTDMVEDVLATLNKLRTPQSKSTTKFTLNYCRGKLDAIKVAWVGRFNAPLEEHLNTLIGAMQKDVTSVDRFLACLAGGGGLNVLHEELDRLKAGK